MGAPAHVAEPDGHTGGASDGTHVFAEQVKPSPQRNGPHGTGANGAQTPALHTPDAQTIPQPPQLFGSLGVGTNPVGQATAAGPHLPAVQVSPAGQVMPHAPQLLGSTWVFVQTAAPQMSPGAGHPAGLPAAWHVPALHKPVPQRMPQPPQLAGSVSMLVQTPLQDVCPAPQVVVPLPLPLQPM